MEKTNTPGPLEFYIMTDHCEMCGASDYKKQRSIIAGAAGISGLEAAFDPDGKPKTLCRQCRIGSAELLADQRANLSDKLAQITDIIVNHYGEEDEPFTKKELKQILDSICEVIDKK